MQDLYDTNPTKLRYVAKVIDVNQGYTNSTPNDVIYEDMDAYIHGDGIERNKATAAKIFLETSKTSMDELNLAAIVADARYYKILMDKSDGFIYTDKGERLGRTMEDALQFLASPLNDEVLMYVLEKVEHQWTK